MTRLIPLAVVCLVAVLAAPALADSPTVTETIHQKQVTESFHEDDPCLGPITVTITYNSVFHITEVVEGPNAGTVHMTFHQAGKFILTPEDPSLPVFEGRFAISGAFNGNRQSESGTFTFHAVGRSADGSRIAFHVVEHFNFTPTGFENSFLIENITCPV